MLSVGRNEFLAAIQGCDQSSYDANCSTAMSRTSYYRNGRKIAVEEVTLFETKLYFLEIWEQTQTRRWNQLLEKT